METSISAKYPSFGQEHGQQQRIFQTSTHTNRSVIVEEFEKPRASKQPPAQSRTTFKNDKAQALLNLLQPDNIKISKGQLDQSTCRRDGTTSRKSSKNLFKRTLSGIASSQGTSLNECASLLDKIKASISKDKPVQQTAVQRLIEKSRKQRDEYLRKIARLAADSETPKTIQTSVSPQRSELHFIRNKLSRLNKDSLTIRHNHSELNLPMDKSPSCVEAKGELNRPKATSSKKKHHASTINNIVVISPSFAKQKGTLGIRDILSSIVNNSAQPSRKVSHKPSAHTMSASVNKSKKERSKSKHNISSTTEMTKENNRSSLKLNSENNLSDLNDTVRLLIRKQQLEKELVTINNSLLGRKKFRQNMLKQIKKK